MNPAGADRISELNEDMVEKIGKMGGCRYRSEADTRPAPAVIRAISPAHHSASQAGL